MFHTRFLGKSKYSLVCKIVRQKSSQASPRSTALNIEKPNDIQDAESPITAYTKFGSVRCSTKKKLPKREPLVKNFFVGVVDKELLAYPEVIPREDMSKLQNEIRTFEEFFQNSAKTENIETTQNIPKDTRNNLKELGFYGFNVKDEFNGKSWEMSESLMASEPETLYPDIALSLISHRAVVDILNEIGTNDQRQRYMAKLATGRVTTF